MKAWINTEKRAFTLVEVLVSVALMGLIASLAFAPVIYAVRQVTESEAAYSDETALRRAAMFMTQDVASGLRLAPTVVRVIAHQELGYDGDDDTLIVASSVQARQNLAAGSIVYRLVRRSFMNDNVPGLYRWLLPGILPQDVEHDKLEAKDGQLIIPHVDGLSVSVLAPPEWVSDYNGKLPPGMKLVLLRERNADEGESVEYVAVFPM